MLDMQDKIRNHLRAQYRGILNSEQIEAHINNYVNDEQSIYLIEKISPIIPLDAKILDVGSGYGSFTLSAIKKGYKCHGVEIASFEHEISKERAKTNEVDHAKVFIHGSALDLPFDDSSFDVVTFWNVLEHIPDYKKAIYEAHRVLKPGGKIFIIAPNYFAFRKEAHYHLPWLPLFPKPLARLYLRVMNRNTYFLNECIFYITSFGLIRFLKSLNFTLTNDTIEKVRKNHEFKSSKVKKVISIFKRLNLTKLLCKFIYILRNHPFSNSIDIIAVK